MEDAIIGQFVGPYKILQKLGEGGMGMVYRAEDTRLERQVALKVFPPHLASDEVRLRRFEREARAVAALNHPNIVTLYSVEEIAGRRFITMELIEGRTLAELIWDGLDLVQGSSSGKPHPTQTPSKTWPGHRAASEEGSPMGTVKSIERQSGLRLRP